MCFGDLGLDIVYADPRDFNIVSYGETAGMLSDGTGTVIAYCLK